MSHPAPEFKKHQLYRWGEKEVVLDDVAERQDLEGNVVPLKEKTDKQVKITAWWVYEVTLERGEVRVKGERQQAPATAIVWIGRAVAIREAA